MDHKAGNQLPHGWMMGFSTVQVENKRQIEEQRSFRDNQNIVITLIHQKLI